MPVAAAWAAVAVAAAGATYQGVQANQDRQHAKGAAEAQKTAMDAQIDTAKKTDEAGKNQKSSQASSTQSAALAAIRASMTANGGAGGTILTGGQGSTPGPVAQKTLLGI